MLFNYIGISILVSIALWSVYVMFYLEVTNRAGAIQRISPSLSFLRLFAKIETIFEKQEDTIKRYLTPIPLKLDTTLLNVQSITEIKQPPVHPENETTASMPKTRKYFSFYQWK